MQGSYFGRVGWHGTVCIPNVFIFVTEKSPTFKRQKYRGKTEKNLIYLNSHTYYVIYCPYCPITSKLKWNASVPRFLLSPSQPLFGLVTQCPLFPVWERARRVTRPKKGWLKRLRLLPVLRQRQNQNCLSTVSYLKNTIPRNFITKSKLKLRFTSNRPWPKTFCDLE